MGVGPGKLGPIFGPPTLILRPKLAQNWPRKEALPNDHLSRSIDVLLLAKLSLCPAVSSPEVELLGSQTEGG